MCLAMNKPDLDELAPDSLWAGQVCFSQGSGTQGDQHTWAFAGTVQTHAASLPSLEVTRAWNIPVVPFGTAVTSGSTLASTASCSGST